MGISLKLMMRISLIWTIRKSKPNKSLRRPNKRPNDRLYN